jgi:hypothetical protein
VTDVSPFRLFGRPPEPDPAPVAPDDADAGVQWAPGPWGTDPGPATRHARPVPLGHRPQPGVLDDPPTDPHGFPPIPPAESWADESWGAPVRSLPRPVPPPVEPPDPLEAAALAGAFAADYLSWDEDDRGRRGRVLADYLAAPVGDPSLLGWNGVGRQRAELALPGRVRPDGDDRVLVDVRVRVTPYREVGDRTADRAATAAEPEPEVPGVPAAAPAPTGRGWRGCASYWIRLIVPVVRDDDRLVVDAGDEALPAPDDDAAVLDPPDDAAALGPPDDPGRAAAGGDGASHVAAGDGPPREAVQGDAFHHRAAPPGDGTVEPGAGDTTLREARPQDPGPHATGPHATGPHDAIPGKATPRDVGPREARRPAVDPDPEAAW